MSSMVSRCTALGSDGRFCEAALDVGPGLPGELRWCTAGLHRWTWVGGSWNHDVDQPPAAVA